MQKFARRTLTPFFFSGNLNPLNCFIHNFDTFDLSTKRQPYCLPFVPHYSLLSTSSTKEHSKGIFNFPFSRDGNYHAANNHPVCPGCGVHMQDTDSRKPGFFSKPCEKELSLHSKDHLVPIPAELQIADIAPADDSPPPKLLSEQAKHPVVCARCHSLRHYGKVKDLSAERLLPEFDFFKTVASRLTSPDGPRTVVLIVVDVSDFESSFPANVAKLVSEAAEENARNWKKGKPGNVARVIVVATKIDLLPTEISPTQFEQWLRKRVDVGGATSNPRVHFVSALRNWGIKDLVSEIAELSGQRGHVWAIGTQNAGKSTLINAMARCGGGEPSYLTEAPLPGTTLGIVRVEGVLPKNAKFFDTPGLLNTRQITCKLTPEEQKLVRIGKELKPRTYRVKEGTSIHIGGLMRLDTEHLSVDSIYVTVWASPRVPLHLGKTANAGALKEEHFGRQLQPPIGEGRLKEMGKWVRHEIDVSCGSWDRSSVDVVGGGIGWFAIGLKGEATLGVWTYEGIEVVVRNSLISHRSNTFEVPGFTTSAVVSKADHLFNKLDRNKKRVLKL